MLCKQHKIQYSQWKDEERDTTQFAGVKLPEDDPAPTFYAWDPEALKNMVRKALRPCPGDPPIQEKDPEGVPLKAGVTVTWENRPPYFYAYPIQYVKEDKKSEESVVVKETSTEEKAKLEDLPAAGTTLVQDEKSPYFFAYPIDKLTPT